MLYKKLSELAEVQNGLVLSRKEAKLGSDKYTKYKNLNLRSINEDGSISKEALDQYLAIEKIEQQFITSQNDIIVRLFPPFHPTLIEKSFVGLVVPSQFAIIRLMNKKEISPQFLCCYLSHRNLLEALAIRESGQASGGIKIFALSDLRVPLLPMERQKVLVAYSEEHTKQRQMYTDLIQQYDLKMDAVMNRAIGGMQDGNY